MLTWYTKDPWHITYQYLKIRDHKTLVLRSDAMSNYNKVGEGAIVFKTTSQSCKSSAYILVRMHTYNIFNGSTETMYFTNPMSQSESLSPIRLPAIFDRVAAGRLLLATKSYNYLHVVMNTGNRMLKPNLRRQGVIHGWCSSKLCKSFQYRSQNMLWTFLQKNASIHLKWVLYIY